MTFNWRRSRNPFAEGFYAALFNEFGDYLQMSEVRQQVEAEGRKWRGRDGNLERYSYFFTPYDRNSGGGPNKDSKDVLQIAPSFLESFRDLSDKSIVKSLSNRLSLICSAAPLVFSDFLLRFLKEDRGLYLRLEAESLNPPVSVRLIRYKGDGNAGTNYHVDKTALSCILFDSLWEHGSKLQLSLGEQFPMQAPITSEFGVSFFSAALSQAGYSQYPAVPHAVETIAAGEERYSVVLFWMLPGVDMSGFSTRANGNEMLGNPRLY